LIDNNLPNVGIYSITQDQNGYLWLASTNTGLMQYDGYQFQQHPLLNNTLTNLKSVPDIDAIVFDQHNNLWA
ncbi:two-component regulator propeller domain-containing protein, partial [Flavobacterium sp. LMO6]